MDRGEVEERDTIVPESAKIILIPALKVGAFTGENVSYSGCSSLTLIQWQSFRYEPPVFRYIFLMSPLCLIYLPIQHTIQKAEP